jgi:hypothetical protein
MPDPIPDSQITQEYRCDVLVVGAGNAGTMALAAAADQGAKVIALEKKPLEKFHVNGAEVGHINSNYLRSKGVPEVDPIDLFNEWLRRAGNRANQSLVMKFCQQCGSVFDYFISVFSPEEMEQVRVKYWPVPKHYTGSMNGYKTWPGTALFPGITVQGTTTITECALRHHRRLQEKGGRVDYGVQALYPLLDGGRVIGVVAQNSEGQYIRYLADKGVILAAGDFGGNPEMSRDLLCDVADLMDDQDRFLSMNMGDGLGIRMGVWAGGCLESRPVATMGGNYNFAFGFAEGFGCLWLDSEGRRYCNEMYSGDSVITGIACNQEKRGPIYSLCDADLAHHLEYGTPCHSSFDTSDPGAWKKLEEQMAATVQAGPEGFQGFHGLRGSVAYSGDSWEEVADRLQLEGAVRETFLASIQRYNQLCQNKRDDDFGKDAQLMIPLDKKPFFAIKIPRSAVAMSLCTVGGLVTDRDQQVLNHGKDPIPGLFATGNCCGRRFGAQYSTPIAGVSIGMALTLGYEAGRHVASLP